MLQNGDFLESSDFESTYACAVKEFLEMLPGVDTDSPLHPVLESYLLQPGKRIRPQLLLAGYRIFSADTHACIAWLLRPAVALELFHNFVLAHDDIIDQAATRRHQPSLQVAIAQSLACPPQQAEHLALVFGDILFSFAVQQFGKLPASAEDENRIRELFLKMAAETGGGQAMELIHAVQDIRSLTEASILQTYYLKTTRYTFEAPLQMGATAAGASGDILSGIRLWTEPLGLAFQIENDLHEFREPDRFAETLPTDLKAGMKTLLLKRYFCGEGKSFLPEWENILTEKTLAFERAAVIIREISRSQTFRELENEVEMLYDKAHQLLWNAHYPEETAQRLSRLVDHLKNLRHHSEARMKKGIAKKQS